MKVIALRKGQYKGSMYAIGDIFEFDEKDRDNPRAGWMGDVVVSPPPKASKKGE